MKKFLRRFSRNHILQFSLPRSGSTLIYNILRELFSGHEIEKCHTLDNRNTMSPIVATYRNPVDIVASLLLCQEHSFTDHEIREQVIKLNQQGIWDLLSIRHLPNLLLLRYEDFVDDYSMLFDNIKRHFDLSIPERMRQEISKKYDRESVQKLTAEYKEFSAYDSKTLFHGRHISQYRGAPNFSEQVFTPEQWSRVACYCSLFMEEMGYSDPESKKRKSD